MSDPAHMNRPGFGDRLLAEAVASGERRVGSSQRAASAEAVARKAASDFELRIIARASAMPEAENLRSAIGSVRRAIMLVVLSALFLGAIAGGIAARTALVSPREPVNVFLLLLGLLGVQTVLLIAWAVVFVAGPRLLRRGSLGGVLMQVARGVSRRMLRQPRHLDAAEAIGRLAFRGRYGTFLISSVSHLFWAIFNVGCLVVIVLLLSTNQYRFVWETTTRTEQQYVAMTRALALAPDRLGFETPSREQIEASRWEPATDAQDAPPSRHDNALQLAWAGMIVGSIVSYGLLPRLLLGALCFVGGMLARRRVRLDVSAPEYAVLRPLLMPVASRFGSAGAEVPETVDSAAPDASPATPDTRPIGMPVIVGLEIDRPACAWPPAVHGLTWDDHGFIDSGASRKAFIESLRLSHTRPGAVVVVCDLTSTPDRGVATFLHDVDAAAGTMAMVLLTGGQRLRDRPVPTDPAQRVEHWRRLVTGDGRTGREVIELDLDHLTSRNQAKLRAVASDADATPTASTTMPSFAESAAIIARHARDWESPPKEAEVVDLFRALQSSYGIRRQSAGFSAGGWKINELLPAIRGPNDIHESIRGGVQNVISSLPASLRAQSRWITAGAVTGAFGCLALTLSIAPAAIGALPAWAALGSAVSAGIRLALPQRAERATESTPDRPSRADAVRSATLYAAMLDLQGRPEAEITQVLDHTFSEQESGDDAPELDGDLDSWLRCIVERYDRATAEAERA